MYDPNKSYSLEELKAVIEKMKDLTYEDFPGQHKAALISAVENEKKIREQK